mgnify:CR=1 FL=1
MIFDRHTFKALRLEKKLTPAEIARLLSIHVSTVSNWETGLRSPKKSHITQIANVLGVRTEDLIEKSASKGILNISNRSKTTIACISIEQLREYNFIAEPLTF